MDTTERKRKERQLIVITVISLAIFAAGWFLLPILTEKILLGVVLVLIAGALFFTNNTGRYICKRVLLALLTIFIIAAITFFAMNAIPGGPFSKEKAPSAAVQAVLEERFHLNEPVGRQFILYLEGLMQGNFGVSTKTGREISTTIFDSFAISAKLGGYAALLAIVLGVCLGSIAALNRAKAADRVIIFFTTLFVAVPSFIMATLLLLVFCLELNWFPIFSTDNQSYVLPVIALMLSPMSYITRLTKTSMLEVLGQDYIRTARAKGVSQWKVIFKHALRNALIPVITYVGPMTAYILTGSMVVENIFSVPGLWRLFTNSMLRTDYMMIMGVTIFLATMIILMNFIGDVLYKVVDPRIDLS